MTLKTQTLWPGRPSSAASANISRSYSIDLSHALTRQIMLGLNGLYVTDNDVGADRSDKTWTGRGRAPNTTSVARSY